MSDRTLAIVLSGGGINGLLLELGFLSGLREDPLWEPVGWIYGTSAGALTGVMAAVDRLDDARAVRAGARAGDISAPTACGSSRSTGLHEYALPDTIAERLMPIDGLARESRRRRSSSSCASRTSRTAMTDEHRALRAASTRSHATDPESMAHAILASAAISALVFPLRVGDVIGTDGGWVRNFPLGHAYDNPDSPRDRRLPLHLAHDPRLGRESSPGSARSASSRSAPCRPCAP